MLKVIDYIYNYIIWPQTIGNIWSELFSKLFFIFHKLCYSFFFTWYL